MNTRKYFTNISLWTLGAIYLIKSIFNMTKIFSSVQNNFLFLSSKYITQWLTRCDTKDKCALLNFCVARVDWLDVLGLRLEKKTPGIWLKKVFLSASSKVSKCRVDESLCIFIPSPCSSTTGGENMNLNAHWIHSWGLTTSSLKGDTLNPKIRFIGCGELCNKDNEKRYYYPQGKGSQFGFGSSIVNQIFLLMRFTCSKTCLLYTSPSPRD